MPTPSNVLRYDRMNALYTGQVKFERIDFNSLAIYRPLHAFDRMVGGREFDAYKLSASEYTCRSPRHGRFGTGLLLLTIGRGRTRRISTGRRLKRSCV